MIHYADELALTFRTPEGHPKDGRISFSARKDSGSAVVQIYGLTSANDPLFEATCNLIGSKIQIRVWKHVLESLAPFLGIPSEITIESKCVDNKIQLSHVGNIWHNAEIRTLAKELLIWLRGTKRFS